MSETNVAIPIFAKANSFEVLDSNGVERALAECLEAGYRSLFAPEIALLRMFASKDDYIVQKGITTPSIRVTGRTRAGNPVVVYAHDVTHYFSNPANITTAREKGLVHGAGKMPLQYFYHLLDLEDGEKVHVLDHTLLQNVETHAISISKAMKQPHTVPFFGGEERAENYLATHKKLYGDLIAHWYGDDLDTVPLGRMLFLGGIENKGLLNSNSSLCGSARFLAFPKEVSSLLESRVENRS